MLRLLSLLLAFILMTGEHTSAGGIPPTPAQKQQSARQAAGDTFGEYYGKPVFLRIIKEDELMELWGQMGDTWRLLKEYPIAAMSGTLGPKTREGDCQAPEGFYAVRLKGLNPNSNYYLSFNIGYPNAYDRSLQRTGSYIMVHGSDVSIGCFAMTDEGIAEIYGMVEAALKAGQPAVPVQVYPFRMTPARMKAEADSPHAEHWKHLLPGWQYTQLNDAPYPNRDADQ